MSALGHFRKSPFSLEHFVGTYKERFRGFEPERIGGLEIDDKLEFCRLLDRQVCGLANAAARSSAVSYPTQRMSELGSTASF